MSDPMTNVEIEDVLTSIRRLVSEDTRAPEVPRALPRLRLDMPAPVGRLVLTPALRIVPGVSGTASAPVMPSLPRAAERPALRDTVPVFDPRSHRAAAAALEAALSTRNDDWEPDGSEIDSDAAWAVEWEAESGQPEAAAVPRFADADLPDPDPAATPVFSRARNRTAPPQVEPTFEWRDPIPASESPTAPEAPALEPAELRSEAPRPAPEPQHVRSESALPADLPADPSGGLSDEIVGAPSGADTARAPGALSDDLDDDPSLFEDETLIDEDALRDLVRDILREELQGTLGERITRNVRKLVRAEINRALAARDLG